MYPHDVTKNYFEGQTTALKTALLSSAQDFLLTAFEEANCSPSDIDWLFTHQVSMHTFKVICKAIHVKSHKAISVFERFGNTAAASIPLSLACAEQQGILKKGDKIAVVGLAAGISASLQLMIW